MSYRARLVSLASLLPLLCWVGLAGAAADGDSIEIHQPLPSTGLVLLGGSQGSGFLVDREDRLLLTNHHVAQKGQSVETIFPIYDMGKVLIRRDLYLNPKKTKRIAGKCVASDSQRDLALLQLQTVPPDVPEVRLANNPPKVGDRAHLLGNPGKSDAVWVYGFGKVQKLGIMKADFGGGLKVQAQTLVLTTDDRRIGPGASGGPVINDATELIGVIQSGPPNSASVNCIDYREVRVFLGDYQRELASAALRGKQYTEAVTRATKALKFNSYDALAHNERGAAYSFQQRYDEAIADYTAAVKLDPKLSRTWRSRATAYFFKGNYDQAVADCTAALKIDPQYAQAYLSRSRAYAKLGKTAEAQADRDRALKLDPTLK
ncbi:MAG: serine protease [Planctomycetia bacterium]|nr:serine protease [Planctomycetia bacterium]